MRKLIFAAIDAKGGAIFSGARVYETANHLWVPEIGVNSDYSMTSSEMLKKFFKQLRARKSPEKYGISPPKITPSARAKKIAKAKKMSRPNSSSPAKAEKTARAKKIKAAAKNNKNGKTEK